MSADQFETTATADGFRFQFDMTLEDFRRWNRYSFGLPMWRRRFTRRVLLVSVLIVCMGLLFMQAYHSAAEFWVLLACIAAWWVLQPQYRKWLAQRNANSTFRAGVQMSSTFFSTSERSFFRNSERRISELRKGVFSDVRKAVFS
ncbi:MAG: hypothetical protein LBR44_05430, partial [Clostridiales Family XIII bacterium]|nr:hypothetical protein [Clostridiales Family XIII bacterium]